MPEDGYKPDPTPRTINTTDPRTILIKRRLCLTATMLLLCLSLTGCGSSAPAADHDYRATAAAILATEDGGATPAPSPTPSPSGKCANCNGKGKLGDGQNFVICPECGGDGIKSDVPASGDVSPEAPESESPDPNAEAKPCANPNCTCDVCSGDCECGMLTDNQREAILAQIKRLETNQAVIEEELQIARADAYQPVKVNGKWYCVENGVQKVYRNGRWVPDVPVKSVLKAKPAPKVEYCEPPMSGCPGGNCPTFGGRGFFGRW